MVCALILMNTAIGAEKQVLEKLRKVEGVVEAYNFRSVYNIAVKVKAGSTRKLAELIRLKIKTVPNIFTTLTLLNTEQNLKAFSANAAGPSKPEAVKL